MSDPVIDLDEDERVFVAQAVAYLERPSFLIRLADGLGRPVDAAMRSAPRVVRDRVQGVTRRALDRGLEWSLKGAQEPWIERPTLDASRSEARRTGRRHHLATIATGAAGGLFGLPSVAVELPITTLLMLRSIARIAADMGADPREPATRLECLNVFSLGSRSPEDDAADSAYLAARLGTAQALREASQYVAKQTVIDLPALLKGPAGTPLVGLIARIASRFQIVVTQKMAAQALVVAGSVGGAAINGAFTAHYNKVATYHFGLRQLEDRLGEDEVRRLYGVELKRLGPGSPGPQPSGLTAAEV